jgi:hypothetical protein
MEHFDLTYTTDNAGDARIVVEALPYVKPEELEQIALPAGQPTMELIFRFPSLDRHLPPGIPTWGIARAHRLRRPGLGPWRNAAFFEDARTGSRAQILASDTAKEVRLKVTADYPLFFMGRMEAILEDTFRRYKELAPQRRLPCPCRPGCPESFLFDVVVRRRRSSEKDITCGDSGANVPLDTLLTGYSPTTPAGRLAEASDLRRMYTALIKALNEQMEKTCPSVFTLGPSSGFKQLPTYWETFTSEDELDLSLYCEYDPGWHLASDSVYRFSPDRIWTEKLKRHWGLLAAITLHVAPLVKGASVLADAIGFDALGEAVEDLHGGVHPLHSPRAEDLFRQEAPKLVDIETRTVLKELIDYLNSKHPHKPRNGGLYPLTVEDGRRLWLYKKHYDEYQKK